MASPSITDFVNPYSRFSNANAMNDYIAGNNYTDNGKNTPMSDLTGFTDNTKFSNDNGLGNSVFDIDDISSMKKFNTWAESKPLDAANFANANPNFRFNDKGNAVNTAEIKKQELFKEASKSPAELLKNLRQIDTSGYDAQQLLAHERVLNGAETNALKRQELAQAGEMNLKDGLGLTMQGVGLGVNLWQGDRDYRFQREQARTQKDQFNKNYAINMDQVYGQTGKAVAQKDGGYDKDGNLLKGGQYGLVGSGKYHDRTKKDRIASSLGGGFGGSNAYA